MNTIIYGLDDPETQQLRYVGKTTRNLSQRLRDHLKDKRRCHRVNWIKNLTVRGLQPGIFEIESVLDRQANEAEKFWIAYFQYIGADLTNGTSGGTGGNTGQGTHRTPEVRAKMSAAQRIAQHGNQKRLGKKHSPETLAKMRIIKLGNQYARGHHGSRGYHHTPEARAKISVASRGNQHALGHKPSLETIAKRSASLKRAWARRKAGPIA